MKSLKNKTVRAIGALLACAALAFGMAACSNGSGGDPQVVYVFGGGQGGTDPQTNEGQNNAEFNLIIDDGIVNGTVTASTTGANPASKAKSGETVTLVMIANAGYELDTISVIADNGDAPQLSDLNVYTKTFVMPNQNVRVRAVFKTLPAGKYSVTPPTNMDGGSVTSSAASSAPGETVTLGATPDEGMRLDSWEVKDADDNPITVTETENGATFVMPEGNVTINATFVKIDYTITINASSNGTVTADKATANYGDTITLTIASADGYALRTLTYTPQDGDAVNVGGGGKSRTFTMPARNVTIRAVFAAVPYKKIGVQEINGVSFDIVEFGHWPQTLKDDSVTIDENDSKTIGGWTYYKGSDGQWYAKLTQSIERSRDGYKVVETFVTYFNGKRIIGGYNDGNVSSPKYFKVEPIKWRVLTENYNKTGKKLLWAENILWRTNFYGYYSTRTVDGAKVYPNNYEHSSIRAFLNGQTYLYRSEQINAVETVSDYYFDKGFLQIAFTEDEKSSIAMTVVDNGARSTLPDNPGAWTSYEKTNGLEKNNLYSCSNTDDKIFLLSMQEITKSDFGFGETDSADPAKHRAITDFSKYIGGMDDFYLLRSPNGLSEASYKGGSVWSITTQFGPRRSCTQGSSGHSIVPALCVE